MVAGTPYMSGFDCVKGNIDKCDEEWRLDVIEKTKKLANEGKIDPVSNLVNKPVYVRGCGND